MISFKLGKLPTDDDVVPRLSVSWAIVLMQSDQTESTYNIILIQTVLKSYVAAHDRYMHLTYGAVNCRSAAKQLYRGQFSGKSHFDSLFKHLHTGMCKFRQRKLLIQRELRRQPSWKIHKSIPGLFPLTCRLVVSVFVIV